MHSTLSSFFFRHLNRVCIIWFMRKDFCLEGKEECVYVCVCVCACVWELCRVLFGFSCFTKIASELHSYEIERPFSASVTQSSPISVSFSWKVKLKQVLFSTADLVKLCFHPSERNWMTAVRGQREGWENVLHKQRSLMCIMLVIRKPWNNISGSKTICNAYVQWT